MIIQIDTFSEVTTELNPMNKKQVRKQLFVESYDTKNDHFVVNWKWSEPYKAIVKNGTDVYEQLMKTFKLETKIQMRMEL